jgi:hypothetical protein
MCFGGGGTTYPQPEQARTDTTYAYLDKKPVETIKKKTASTSSVDSSSKSSATTTAKDNKSPLNIA